MDQNRRAIRGGDDSQKTNDIFPLRMPGLHVHAFIRQSRIPDFVLIGMEGAQIDNGFNSQLFQILHSLFSGLGAPIQVIADFMKVRHAFYLDRLRPG